jgi:hypothetical protein
MREMVGGGGGVGGDGGEDDSGGLGGGLVLVSSEQKFELEFKLEDRDAFLVEVHPKNGILVKYNPATSSVVLGIIAGGKSRISQVQTHRCSDCCR